MPVNKSKNQKAKKYDFQKIVENNESYRSLIYGIITVVVLFIVLFIGLKTLSKNKAEISQNAVNTIQKEKVHVVIKGETLWSIAEKEFGDGFKWEVIAKANNINEASNLIEGTKIKIPEKGVDVPLKRTNDKEANPTFIPAEKFSKDIKKVEEPKSSVTAKTGQKISSTTYTVVKGDTLWDIAVRAYGDGYRWTQIAKENNLINPDLIHPGNVFKLKRP